jgi:hypothetical protein
LYHHRSMRRLVWTLSSTLAFMAGCTLDAAGLPGSTSLHGGKGDATLDASARDSTQADSSRDADSGMRPADASVDSPSLDAHAPDAPTPDDAIADTSNPMDAADADVQDSGFVFICGGGMTDNCSTCAGNIVGCLWCNGDKTYGFCIPVGQQCKDHVPPGAPVSAAACTCVAPDASTCIAQDQVCYQDTKQAFCLTCGQGATAGLTCKGGGTCHASEATCE